jgi:hypothetical protein
MTQEARDDQLRAWKARSEGRRSAEYALGEEYGDGWAQHAADLSEMAAIIHEQVIPDFEHDNWLRLLRAYPSILPFMQAQESYVSTNTFFVKGFLEGAVRRWKSAMSPPRRPSATRKKGAAKEPS